LVIGNFVLSETQQTLSSLVEDMIEKFPCSGEINFKVADTQATIQKIFDHFADQNPAIDETDGISLNFGAWRLNVRASILNLYYVSTLKAVKTKIHNQYKTMWMN
jgi:phosphomannomutase